MPHDLSRLADRESLRRFMEYQKDRDPEAWRAGFARLCELEAEGSDDPQDPLVKDFWRAVAALEEVRYQTHGKRVLAARTRQKVARDGVVATVAALAARPTPTPGFHYLVKERLFDHTAEFLTLKYADRFSKEVRSAARMKLEAIGLSASDMPPVSD